MTTNWKGGDGDWQTAANWTNGAPTVPSAFAVINAAGLYTVTIGTGLEYHVGAVSLNAAGATLSVAGILDLTNKLTISKGTLALSGTIADGTIVAAGGTVKLQGATLDGMTYAGAINLSTNAASITVKDGLTLTDVKGTGLGALSLAGSSQINFMGDQTLHHGTFRIIGGAVNVTGILTFAGRMKILYSAKRSVFSAGASIVNQGSFSIGKKANFSPKNGQFSNSGRVIVNGGAARLKSFSNQASGTVDLQSGSLFGVNALDNQGTITANAATVRLTLADGGSFGILNISNSTVSLSVTSQDAVTGAIDQLAGHNNALSVSLNIDNSGTLTLSTPSGFKTFTYGGIIGGGTVKLEAGFNGTLAGLTAEGTLTTSQVIINNVAFTGADGTGKGTIALDGTLQYGQRAGRVIPPLPTFDNVNIVAQAGSAMNILGEKLTLGAGLTLKANGTFAISFISSAPNTLMNEGILEADGASGTAFTVIESQFYNAGTIRVENGGTFSVSAHDAFQNFSFGTLTGGTYDIGAHSTFEASFVNRVKILQASVALDGAGATFVNLAGLSTIGTQGSLALGGGATLSVSSAVTIDGALDLDGSSFTSANITIHSGGSLTGNGAVLGAVANSGLIDASGGTLSIGQDVTGTGQTKIEAGATLEFGSDASAGQTVTFESTTGTLALGNAGGFDGTIAGFAQGDTIDLINTKATAVTYDSGADTLTIRNKATVVATLNLSGDYTGDMFGLASDGNGGTAITLTGVAPATVQRFTEAAAVFAPTSMASTGSNLLPDVSLQSSALAASAGRHFGHA